MSDKLRALDLFSGAGGATRGLQMVGFHVTGVDIEPQPRYCGDAFFQADALTFDLAGYDFIWASPPCQFGSVVTPKAHRAKHRNLIPAIRERLLATAKPYVIENVEGVRRHLRDPIKLCGSMFGLRCRRHRYFECPSIWSLVPPCKHDMRPLLVTTAGSNSRATGNFKTVKNAPLAYGIDWMTADELKEAIPPLYAEFLGRQIMAACFEKAA